MVKAIKRKTGKETGKKKRGKFMTNERMGQIMIMIILALIVIGFTVNVPFMFGGRGDEPGVEIDEPQVDYGLALPLGTMQASVKSIGDDNAVFGQLDLPLEAERRLNGQLYSLNNGLSQLILTNASRAEIDQKVSGNYIVYKIADCDEFDCLIRDEMNGTQSFDVYEVDEPSSMLKTMRVGLIKEQGVLTL
jgi:hypothetical protein